MVETLAGSLAVVFVVPVIVICGLAVAYLSLRIRDSRSETPDPELGIKSAYHAFMSVGILLVLTGLTISATDFLSELFEDKQKQQPQFLPPQFGPQGKFGQMQQVPVRQPDEDPFDRLSQRVAWPLVISGCLFSLVGLLLLTAGTNDGRFPAVKRTFGGLRLIIEGLNVMAGVTFLITLLFQKDVTEMRAYAIALALIVIWFPAAAVQVFLLKMWGKLPYYVPPKPKKSKRPAVEDRDEDDEEPKPRERRRPPRLPREDEEE
jgi:hypothetical protein